MKKCLLCKRSTHCALGTTRLGLEEDVSFQYSRLPPLPDEAQNAPILDPLLEKSLYQAVIQSVEKSTHICVHDPVDPLRPTLLPKRGECLVRAAPGSKAIHEVVKVLFVDGPQQHGYSTLPDLVFKRGDGQGQLHCSSTSFRTSLRSRIRFIPFGDNGIPSSLQRSGSNATS